MCVKLVCDCRSWLGVVGIWLLMLERLVRMARVRAICVASCGSVECFPCQGVSSNDAEAAIFAVCKCSIAGDKVAVASASSGRI